MKLYNRIFSTLLAVILLLGAFSCFTVGVSAADSKGNKKMEEDVDLEQLYISTVYNTPEEKLNSGRMELKLERNGYKLYVDPYSGEIATVDAAGNILFSNPYDVASSIGSNSTKKQILSQLVVQYLDNGAQKNLYSFEEAALRDQIKVLNIKNGVRVEYTIGREESRKLVPRWISEENYLKYIDAPLRKAVENGEIQEWFYQRFSAFYSFKCLDDMKTKIAKDQLLKTYPICAEMNIYTFKVDATSVEINWCETYVKNYCEEYSFELMDADHEETGYPASDEQYPVFKMALEYSLDENGLAVRLPCNGLRYDMSLYTLENISILPYMGAGNSANPGYNFYPDGAGSLFDFEQLNTKATTRVSGKVYGIDYAYHNIGSNSYQKTIRYPVYGTVSSETLYTFSYSMPDEVGNMVPDSMTVSKSVMDIEEIMEYIESNDGILTSDIVPETYDRGYVAIIESGESLATLETYHAGALSDYNSMMNYFNPKPKDSYDISDAISVTSSSTWTVVSERKYTGSIRIRYRMLCDPDVANSYVENTEEVNTYAYYETSWLGMAEAYRDYLVSNNTLTKLENAEENIPLYLEVFGAIEVQKQILTVPVDVMTPLTTFGNIYDIYTKLSASGVKNINFKMTGFANGGMYSKVPASLKWEKAVGGKAELAELIKNATAVNEKKDEHLGLYPDFDFAYIQVNELFDSTNLKKDAVRTIDDRYTSFRQYSATQQSYVSFYQLAISPSRYEKFYTKLLKNYEKYGLKSMSVASLGTALNSDFDEKDPYNREDSKEFTVKAFEDLKEAGYSLMTEGANAYTWGYVDHILNVDLDSSRYVKSSASVPFIGVVLHGYMQFAGTPFNEEGDTNYAILRALENGAGMYFILSYQNTNELKEDLFLSQYYSVRYDIWEEDVIAYYNELNGLLKDLQEKEIIGHKFLNDAIRVLEIDELKEEIQKELEEAAAAAKKEQQDKETAKSLEVADAWRLAEFATAKVLDIKAKMIEINQSIEENSLTLDSYIKQLPTYVKSTLAEMSIDIESSSTQTAIDQLNLHISSIKSLTVNILKGFATLEQYEKDAKQLILDIEKAKTVIENSTTIADPEVKKAMADEVEESKKEVAALIPEVTAQLSVCTAKGITGDGSVTKAVEALSVIKETETQEILATALEDAVKDSIFDAEMLYEAGKLEDGKVDPDITGTEDSKKDKHVSNNNQVVVVTYGDRAGAEEGFKKTPDRSFILNYNNYSVRVTYKDKSYTIPSGGYVVVDETTTNGEG